MLALLVDVAERNVVPDHRAAMPGRGRAVRGQLRAGSPRARLCHHPADLGAGRAGRGGGHRRAVIAFALQIPNEDHEDGAEVLRQLDALAWARPSMRPVLVL
ncbi:hypothetical protein [Streptomyces sp. ISL-36]|uniref:hypothetical protein n=1 Tax=Streptomyces sp. ISL-36 TaxID=2819182 RepID=UPI002036185C|nr:hypothetical protein [Streptomyces sp. ISL-36]